MSKSPNRHLFISAISICLSGLGHAAPITWSAPQNTTGKDDFIEGTVVAALNGGATSPTITDISFVPGTNTVTLTWTSTPGTVYAIRYSLDLVDFEADIDDAVNASPGETTTAPFTLPVDLIGQPRVFFRVDLGE